MTEPELTEKVAETGVKVWEHDFPKLPVFQSGQGRLEDGTLDKHYSKMLVIGQEGLKKFFSNDAGLSGRLLRQVEAKEQLKQYRKSVPNSFGQAEKRQLWQAVQMASQEIFLEKEVSNYQSIPPRHKWQFAENPNDEIKTRMLNEYLARVGKGKGVSANYVNRLMLEYKIRRGYEKAAGEPERKKIANLQDILAALARYDLPPIISMDETAFIVMVNGLTSDERNGLKQAFDKMFQWLEKGLSDKYDYLKYKVTKESTLLV